MTDEAKSMARSMSSGAAMNKHSAVSLGRSTTQLAIGGTTTDGLRQDDIGHLLGWRHAKGKRRSSSAPVEQARILRVLIEHIDVAPQECVMDASACRLLPLTCLAPDIVEASLDGRQPKGLRLVEMLGNGPGAWVEQRTAWGCAQSRSCPACRRYACFEKNSA
jgi:hypothetical protein